MELSSAFYGAFALFLLLCYYLFTNSFKPKHKLKLPPQATGGRLILGHLHLMGARGSSTQPPHINLGALADRHGPIFTIRLGTRRVLVVSSSKVAKELFTVNDIAISSRPKTRSIKHMCYDFAMFGFAPYGAYWRDVRKLVNSELLSSRRVEMLSHVLISEITQSVRELYTLWEEKKDESGMLSVDLKKWFCELNLNTTLRLVVGKRFGGGRDDGEMMWRWREVLSEFFHFAGVFVAADAFPWLGWLDLGGLEKRMKATGRELDEILGGWVEERRRRKDSGDGEGYEVQDFLDVMLSAVQHLDFGDQHDTTTILKSTCLSMILGGSDTSSVTLTWVLSLLLNNPHTLAKAQAELDKHVGRERRVKESDIANFQYLQCVVKETLRLYPSGPLGAREFAQDCNVAGYYVPKGTWLMVNIWKLQRDPEDWPENPIEFDPDRFITMYQNVDVKGQNFELIPFGAGRRMCPGLNLAIHMVQLTLANLLQAFDVRKISDEAVDMTESAGLTNPKATPLEVLIAPRLPPNLY